MNTIGEFSRQFGLGIIAKELGVEFVAHRAVDDAYATMCIAQALCKAENNATLPELIEKHGIKLGKIADYEITPTTSAGLLLYRQELERKKEEREKLLLIFCWAIFVWE